jgi:hypothetical protein
MDTRTPWLLLFKIFAAFSRILLLKKRTICLKLCPMMFIPVTKVALTLPRTLSFPAPCEHFSEKLVPSMAVRLLPASFLALLSSYFAVSGIFSGCS